jgi:hypothetical protein
MTQDDYIDILFNDLCFSLIQKRTHLLDYYGVTYVSELPKSKKSELIDELKEMKENKK